MDFSFLNTCNPQMPNAYLHLYKMLAYTNYPQYCGVKISEVLLYIKTGQCCAPTSNNPSVTKFTFSHDVVVYQYVNQALLCIIIML